MAQRLDTQHTPLHDDATTEIDFLLVWADHACRENNCAMADHAIVMADGLHLSPIPFNLN